MRKDQNHFSRGGQLLPCLPQFPQVRTAFVVMALPSLLTLLAPHPLEAQLRFVPFGGAYAPLSEVGAIRDAEGATFLEAGKRASTLALGAGVEVGPLRGLANLRGEVTWATSADVPVRGIGCAGCGLRSSVLVTSGALVLRPFMDLMVVQPYLVLGAGAVRYDFDWKDMRNEGPGDYFRDQTRPSFHLGLGSQFHLGALRPRLEVSAHVSRYEAGTGRPDLQGTDDRQTSLFLTLGIPLGGS